MDFETIIGLEVHAQLSTRSKMYCRCSADYASAPPNTHVCPVCLGMPGVLPTINREALAATVKTALALNCSISELTKFDRKNYPYPDLMKGYQISQYDMPVGLGGWMEIEVNGGKRRVGITRVHLEEDVAKLLHREEGGEAFSLVDVNRSGVPLMEIVGEPDLRSPEEARQYLMKLHTILQYLGVSTANMEEGSFRCDANISIRPCGTKDYLAKVEVKNMNSFKAVFRALTYEEERQRRVAARGERLIQETRGWVEDDGGKTVSQRSKEYAHDYRYFPEPDLPPVVISREWVEEIKSNLPELPEARRGRFMTQFNLPFYDADLLTASRAMADYFEDCLKVKEFTRIPGEKGPKEVANWLLGEVSRIINDKCIDVRAFRDKVAPERLVKLLALNAGGEINAQTAKAVLEEMFDTGRDAAAIMAEKGLGQINDTRQIELEIENVIAGNASAVADYRAGKPQALKFLVGQVMRATGGRANPNIAGDLLKKKLEEG